MANEEDDVSFTGELTMPSCKQKTASLMNLDAKRH